MTPVSKFQEVLESIEVLSISEQEALIYIVQRRLAKQRRKQIAANIGQAMEEHRTGEVVRGNVDEIMAKLKE